MDRTEAERALRDIDDADRDGRVARLMELSDLLPEAGEIGFSGQAGQWLFEDVKATWLYGCFVATVLSAAVFCQVQLAGLFRSLPDDAGLPEQAASLEELARSAAERGLIDTSLQAQLVVLNDAANAYLDTGLHATTLGVERRLVDADLLGAEDHPLLQHARAALAASVALLFRR
jgi:hypothetical protein